MKSVINLILMLTLPFFSIYEKQDISEFVSQMPLVSPNNSEKQRQSITFILGEDKEMDNRYYQMAEAYYRSNAETKNDLLITTCRSLKSVRDYLENHPADGEQAWGKVNLVVHSNEWKGLAVPVLESGTRATYSILAKAIEEGKFMPVDAKILDNESEIVVLGCGFGKNKAFMKLIGEAFNGKNVVCSKVSASEYFIMYDDSGEVPARYEADCFYGFFKTGYRPSDFSLTEQLSSRYPNQAIEWEAALSRKTPRFPGDVYHYFFNVPVKWVVTYPSKTERPKLNNKKAKEKWLAKQTELIEAIQKTNIPMDKFRWRFKNTNYTFEDGTTEAAIVVEGKASVLCVLRARV